MSWLLVAKILPPFRGGEPPTTTPEPGDAPAAWRIQLNDRQCGLAVIQAVDGAAESTEIHSCITLDSIPLPEVAPAWMSGMLATLGEVSVELRTRTTLDAIGNLAAFQTKIRLDDTPALVRVSGVVQDDMLDLRVRTGDFSQTFEYPWRRNRMLNGELMPDATFADLHVGKRWRKEIYSLFGGAGDPLQSIEAEVVDYERIATNNSAKPVYRIEYRSVAAAGVDKEDRLLATVWVSNAGRVLRQDVTFLNTRLRFDRVARRDAREVAEEVLDLARYATKSPRSDKRNAPEEEAPRNP